MPRKKKTKVCCDGCRALLAECGEERFPLYAKKLLDNEWGGSYSTAEKTYRRYHRTKGKGVVVDVDVESAQPAT